MSEDVSQFLQQVKELGDRRAVEDEARSRELEEKILQDKKERQARRAERARSISPQKSSPANTPPPTSHRATTPGSPRPNLDESSPTLDRPGTPLSPGDPAQPDAMSSHESYSSSKENESPFDGDGKRASNPGSPTRSATVRGLSWQRRPNSQASNGSRSRPLSMVAAENAARSSTASFEPSSATDTASRDQIAQSLASKDPAWFRQTTDRGASSGAYRKSQVEDDERMDLSSMKAQLPGMGTASSSDPFKEDQTSHVDPAQFRRSIGSPLSLTSPHRLDPPGNEDRDGSGTPDRQASNSPSPTRTSPSRHDRPVSPTKGMGGFVQSAMMKRNDSVNKRWSLKSPEGLQRADTIASKRNSIHHTRGLSGAQSRPTSQGRENSVDNTSPPSSQGTQEPQAEHSIAREVSESLKINTEPAHVPPHDDADDGNLPTSSSKTLDPRRWSPTKASWLESALNKPESPKPKMIAPPPSQPAWMAEIAKAKAQKAANPNATAERTRSPTISHKHEVSIGGLMRSSAPGVGAKPGSISSTSPTVATNRTGSWGSRKGSVVSGAGGDGGAEPETPPSTASSIPKSEAAAPADLRASLKTRPGRAPSSATESAEFKNVFGNLRKTATQNYKAPDELKDNILRGKAGLNVTGGPKKSEIKDEFKDAILAKKAAFQQVQSEGRGITRNSSNASEQPVPEGLTRRLELGRSNTLKRSSVISDAPTTPREAERPSSVISKSDSNPSPTSKSPGRFDSPSPEKRESIASSVGAIEARRPSIGIKKDSVSAMNVFKAAEEAAKRPSPPREPVSVPGRVPGKLAGSALANRFNPALAGLLARGPPPMSTGAPSSTGSPAGGFTGRARSSTTSGAESEAAPGPKLTHMTKGRARGPKRKAPTAAAPAASTGGAEPVPAAPEAEPKETPAAPSPATPSPEVTEEPAPAAVPAPQASPVADLPKEIASSPRPKALPISPVDLPKPVEEPSHEEPPKAPSPVRAHARRKSRVLEQAAAFGGPKSPSPTKQQDLERSPSQSPSPRKLNLNRMSRFAAEASPERSPVRSPSARSPVRSPEREAVQDIKSPVTAQPKSLAKSPVRSPESEVVEDIKSPVPAPQLRSPVRSPVKSPEPEAIPDVQPPVTTPPLESQPNRPQTPASSVPTPTTDSFKSPPPKPGMPLPEPKALPDPPKALPELPKPSTNAGFARRGFNSGPAINKNTTPFGSKPLPSVPSARPTTPGRNVPAVTDAASPMRSPTKQAVEASSVLNEFFGLSRPPREYRVDAAELLMQKPNTSAPGIRSLSVQLMRLTADGKKVPVHGHYERVLFEQEMYLCPHTFTNESGKKVTEVYFWAGDGVSASEVEDASIFVSREAKAFGGKLVKLQQGKETPEFIAALGGIVITRRGSSNKYDSLAPHLLCGRQYMGHVVFDEVDFAAISLCAGFPYIITNTGKCYLWKGKGSGVDELSCARLIGMDYSLSGDIEEIEDSHEPDHFWNLFSGVSKPGSADHWRLKPHYDKYGSRMFCSDASSKQQIIEISPFSQADLQPTGIYVLDAFFELYIIVGARAQPHYASFHNALEFAQEYAILAAGMEDRPFVPVSTVILEGIPRDMKGVFRKWRDADSPTIMNPPGSGTGLRRGRSLRIVPLNTALQALRE